LPRSVPEWVGKRPESMPGNLVLLRIYARQNGLCGCGCGRVMNLNRDKIDREHTIPLIDGGENRESNLTLMLHEHHVPKTAAEASQRAEARQHQAKAFTRPPSKLQSPGFPRAQPQRRATSPLKPKYEGDIMSKKGTTNV
jgi:5-methylcytosine-specific restriction protein A